MTILLNLLNVCNRIGYQMTEMLLILYRFNGGDKLKEHGKPSSNQEFMIWNILFMAPRIKMIVIKTYFGAVVVKRCDVSGPVQRTPEPGQTHWSG